MNDFLNSKVFGIKWSRLLTSCQQSLYMVGWGLLIGTFLLIVFVTRFLLEFIKNDQEAFEAGHVLNMGQWLSIPFIVFAVWLVVRAFKREMNPDTAIES